METAKQKMLIARVDARDRVIGKARRQQAVTEPINFRVAHLFLFDEAKHLLLQKIADGKRHAGMWGSSAATYVRAGETYRKAIDRAARDELGLDGLTVKARGTTSMKDGAGTKFIGVFVAHLVGHGSLHVNIDETEGVEFVAIPQLQRQIEAGSRRCTPTFLRVLEFHLGRTM